MSSILLVDDDKEILTINGKYFKQKGYDVKVTSTAKGAIKAIELEHFDCILMDVMMPGMDGFTACEKIRAVCDTPIIFLTGKDTEDDKINGLLLGADDYVIKPYSLRELEARIQVLIRRYHNTSTPSGNMLEYPPLRIDTNRHKVYCDQEEILLSNREYDLLYLLASHPKQVFTFEEIGNQIWNGYMESDRKTIMVTASRLRKKLDSYPDIANCIETVWSKGYQFVK